jgi:hypothetical protein
MHSGLAAQRLVALFVAGWLLFNFPLLSLWQRAGGLTIWGLPLLPAGVFIGWAVLIAVLAWVSERGDPPG